MRQRAPVSDSGNYIPILTVYVLLAILYFLHNYWLNYLSALPDCKLHKSEQCSFCSLLYLQHLTQGLKEYKLFLESGTILPALDKCGGNAIRFPGDPDVRSDQISHEKRSRRGTILTCSSYNSLSLPST